MEEPKQYSTSSLGPWHRNMGYIAVTSLVGSAVTACAARYFYYNLTGTPQYILRTYKFTKILSGLLLAAGAASTIQSYCIDSFKQMAECKFALWNIQSKKLPFHEVKSLYRKLINLHSFQKEYIPLLLADLKAAEDYPTFIKLHGEEFVRYLEQTGNAETLKEKKEAYKAEIVKRLKSSLGAVPNDPVNHLLVLSQHASYGKEFLGAYFENKLKETLTNISWHACFNECAQQLSTLFQKGLISFVNHSFLKTKFLQGLAGISTNIIHARTLHSKFSELAITDSELYEAATTIERSQWMSGKLSYFDLRGHNDSNLANHLSGTEKAKLQQEMHTWSYGCLVDPIKYYINEKHVCRIDEQKIKSIIQDYQGDYLTFREFHGIDALTVTSEIQKTRFKNELEITLGKDRKYTDYKVDCEKLGINPSDIFLLKQWREKGYFKIIAEEGNPNIFFEAIQKGYIQADQYTNSTLQTLDTYTQPTVLCPMIHNNFRLFSTKVLSPISCLFSGISLGQMIGVWICSDDLQLKKSAITLLHEFMRNPGDYDLTSIKESYLEQIQEENLTLQDALGLHADPVFNQFCSKKDVIFSASEKDRMIWAANTVSYADLHKKYGSTIAQCMLGKHKDLAKKELLGWSYEFLISPTYQLDRETLGITESDINQAIQNFKGPYFGDRGFLRYHGRTAISRLKTVPQRFKKEVESALATSSYEALEGDCKALGINRGASLKKKWQGKGYFQICLEENGSQLFWEAIKANLVSADDYRNKTLQEIRDALIAKSHSDEVGVYETYMTELLKEHFMLFMVDIISRGDKILHDMTIEQFFYYYLAKDVANLPQNQSYLQSLENTYGVSIWSIGLLHPAEMQFWIANEIRAIIDRNAPRDRYKVCLENSLVCTWLYALLSTYDKQVKELPQQRDAKIKEHENKCTKAKTDALSQKTSALTVEEKKLNLLKAELEKQQEELKKVEKQILELDTNGIGATILKYTKTLQNKNAEFSSIKEKIAGSSYRRHVIGKENSQLEAKIREKKKSIEESVINCMKIKEKELLGKIQNIVQLETNIPEQEKLLTKFRENKIKKDELTLQLEGLKEEQENLPKVVTGVPDALALEAQKKALSDQIQATTVELAPLNSHKDPSIEETQATINSMKGQKISLGDGSKEKARLTAIQLSLLESDKTKQEISKAEEQIATNKKTLDGLDLLPAQSVSINNDILILEETLKTLERQKAQELASHQASKQKHALLVNQAQDKYKKAQAHYEQVKKQQHEKYNKYCKESNVELEMKINSEKDICEHALRLQKEEAVKTLDDSMVKR